ncbi:MAG: DUF2791 family P-loop domain-containing protein [Candidatus Atribacteria bacterium]|nr:DUF2791 family P-loop domain-containing protein [Candidatus Atribacteria bacterium]
MCANGGSKVKILVGKAGSGKTHLLRHIEYQARKMGYVSVIFSARMMEKGLNDIVNFYKEIVRRIDFFQIIKGLALKIAKELGYGIDHYDGEERLLPLIIEGESSSQDNAKRIIRKAVGEFIKKSNLSPSFAVLVINVLYERLIGGENKGTDIALKWLSGEKLERSERQSSNLFEFLQKSNARYWLNSLIRLLLLSGQKGLVVLIDEIEVLTERDELSKNYRYTRNATGDAYEIFRQIIDDVELLEGFLLILAGRWNIVDDESRGFQSYRALWMRLQTGLKPSEKFNPYADIVNLDTMFQTLGEDFLQKLSKHLIDILQKMGYARKYREIPDLSVYSPLRATVIENAMMIE